MSHQRAPNDQALRRQMIEAGIITPQGAEPRPWVPPAVLAAARTETPREIVVKLRGAREWPRKRPVPA